MDLGTIFNTAVTYGLPLLAVATPILSGLYTVGQQHKGLVTRFGKHVRTNETPGLKLKIPFIESVKKISMQERQVDEALTTKTTDDLFVELPISVHYQVSDPAVYYFDKEDPVRLMKKVVAASVRKYTSAKSFQELYDERSEIKEGVLDAVHEQVPGYGIQINDIVIDEPQASDDVKKTFDRVRSSALEKDAAKNEAEADFIRKVKSAEADKQRNILIGEGVAGFREKIASGYSALRQKLIGDGVDPAAADTFMAEAMRLDTLRDIGDKGNMVIVSPDSASGNRLAELQTLGTTVGRKPTAEQDTAPVRREQQGPAAPSA